MPEHAASPASLVRLATARLRAAGVADAAREARELWGAEQADSPWVAERPASDRERAGMAARMARRLAGEPLAHVTGVAGFRHLLLRSDSRALIPRPETEGLVDQVLARIRTGRAADLGTGTGCLALSLALEGSFEQVVAIDFSSEALALAAENRALTAQQIQLVRGDLVEPLRGEAFDLLLSNPPYLTLGEWERLDPSVRRWEPFGALASGVDGLAHTRRILEEGSRVVRPGGWIALELDARRAAITARLAVEAGWTGVTVREDLFGRARYLLAQRSEAA